MRKDLLDELTEGVGCNYLSDLRQSGNFKRVARYLDTIDVDMYSEKQWKDAIAYILGENARTPKKGESLKDFLCREIRKR